MVFLEVFLKSLFTKNKFEGKIFIYYKETLALKNQKTSNQ